MTDATERDITAVEIPDPQPGYVDEPTLMGLHGRDRYELLKALSLVAEYQRTTAMLREQVAAWQAKYEAVAPKAEAGA